MDQIVNQADLATGPATDATSQKIVRHFRQILLWPVHLLNRGGPLIVQDHANSLAATGGTNPWQEVLDEFGEPEEFCERHYYEFVTFLPPVQRFLYGQALGKAVRRGFGESPIRVMRRSDIAKVRVLLERQTAPIELGIAHVDLYFFFDTDVAMLALEVFADNQPLDVVQEAILQLGRIYPSHWTETGRAFECPLKVEWLGADGALLAASDYDNRSKYLGFVCQHRATQIAAHWQFLMQPLVLHHADVTGDLRFRLLEGSRLPVMAYLALEDPQALCRADYVRLAYACGSGEAGSLPYSESALIDFETTNVYERRDDKRNGRDGLSVRYVSSANTFIVTGDARNAQFTDAERGDLSRFRHQHFLLFLIVHFHKAALLMFSDRLAAAVNKLDVNDYRTITAFRADTRQALEKFLRFTHRYWFHSLSEQYLAHKLFTLCRRHLGLDALFEDIRQEVQEMSQYLENEAMRRQNDSMVRLTVVTTFGLIGTITTGFLGMNLFDHTGLPVWQKVAIFAVIIIPTMLLTLYTVLKSRRLSEFLDALSDEAKGAGSKWRAFLRVWFGRKRT